MADESNEEDVALDLHQELMNILNKYSVDNQLNTPDFILATYVIDCLKAFGTATTRRDNYLDNEKKRRTNVINIMNNGSS